MSRCLLRGPCPPNPVFIDTAPVVMLSVDTGPPPPAAFDVFCCRPRRDRSRRHRRR